MDINIELFANLLLVYKSNLIKISSNARQLAAFIEKYRIIQDRLFQSDFDKEIMKQLKDKE